MSDSLQPLRRLNDTLQQRAVERPAGSYTTKLLDGGPNAIGAKIREEAEELIEAAAEPDQAGRDHAVREAGDLLYHTLVLLAWRGIDLDEVAAELARREGTSGLAEKAARSHTARPAPDLSTRFLTRDLHCPPHPNPSCGWASPAKADLASWRSACCNKPG